MIILLKWFRNRRRLTKPASPAKVVKLSDATKANLLKVAVANQQPVRTLG